MKMTSSYLAKILFLFWLGFIVVSCHENGNSIVEKTQFEIEEAKINFGKKLFFDRQLSNDNSISCSDCHRPNYAFADTVAFSRGVSGHHSIRNSSTLLNIGDSPVFMFDGHIKTLEMQAIVPIQDSNEMGSRMSRLIQRLGSIKEYQQISKTIYKRKFDAFVLTRALASYQKSLVSKGSRFDAFFNGDSTALSYEEADGWRLFSEILNCTSCHPAPNFTTYKTENNGVYKDGDSDMGRFKINNDSSEIGFFKVPTLRNIALTSPYMHNGSITNLSGILEHYLEIDHVHPNTSMLLKKKSLSEQEKENITIFLEALTDTLFVY